MFESDFAKIEYIEKDNVVLQEMNTTGSSSLNAPNQLLPDEKQYFFFLLFYTEPAKG